VKEAPPEYYMPDERLGSFWELGKRFLKPQKCDINKVFNFDTIRLTPSLYCWSFTKFTIGIFAPPLETT